MITAQYGVNYWPGRDQFEYTPGNIVSGLIDDVERLDEYENYKGYIPSHTWKVLYGPNDIPASIYPSRVICFFDSQA